MDRRTFLQLVAPGVVAQTKARPDRGVPPVTLPHEEADDYFLRDIAQGRARRIGSLPPTSEMVLSTERVGPRTSLARFSTLEDYSNPEVVDDQNPRCVHAALREPTLSIIGPTPYRVALMPNDDLTAFVTFVRPVRLCVYVRRYACVDIAALVDERFLLSKPLPPPDRRRAASMPLEGHWG
jgi:hypothetical protein